MVFKILLVFAVVVASILIVAATRPDTLHVTRSITINALPEKIFVLIDDFHNWTSWAPQDRDDPSMTRTYSGPASGKGAVSQWSSSGSAGRGTMSIIESTSPSAVSIKVDFVKPFAAHNLNDFTLEPAGHATRVTWTMHGTNLFVMKVMSVFTNMDKVAGKHFEQGLANLKTLAER